MLDVNKATNVENNKNLLTIYLNAKPATYTSIFSNNIDFI